LSRCRAAFQWPQIGGVDYEEWFDSVDIASAPLGEVACIIAELYRGLFEVCKSPFLSSDACYDSCAAADMQRVGPKIKASNPQWQIRPRDNARGICFGQLRLTQLYSYDGTRIYPEIVVVTPR